MTKQRTFQFIKMEWLILERLVKIAKENALLPSIKTQLIL
jgi:hypothetical protein